MFFTQKYQSMHNGGYYHMLNWSKLIVTLLILSSMAIGLSSCDWSGSGQGNSHFNGTLQK